MGRAPDAADSQRTRPTCRILLTHRSSSSRHCDVQRRRVVGAARDAHRQRLLQPADPSAARAARRRRRSRARSRDWRPISSHREIFVEPTSKDPNDLTHIHTRFPFAPHPTTRFSTGDLARIERLALPNELRRGIQLLQNCGCSPCSSAASRRWRRRAPRRPGRCARRRPSASSSTPRRCNHREGDGRPECVRVADEQRAAESVARVAPLAPTEADYDSDDYA